MNLNEVTLSRKNCKINTSQPTFRWLVVDENIVLYQLSLVKRIINHIFKYIIPCSHCKRIL